MAIPTKDPLNVETLNFDSLEDRRAFYAALNAVGREKAGERLRALRDRGIVDQDGNLTTTALPPDMLDRDASVEQ